MSGRTVLFPLWLLIGICVTVADERGVSVDTALDSICLGADEGRPINCWRVGVDEDWVRTFSHFQRLINTPTNLGISVYLSTDLLLNYRPMNPAEAAALNLWPKYSPPGDGKPDIPIIGEDDIRVTARLWLNEICSIYDLKYTVTKQAILVGIKSPSEKRRRDVKMTSAEVISQRRPTSKDAVTADAHNP